MADLFWSDAKQSPKRQFQFYVETGLGSTEIPVWSIKTATIPKSNISSIEHSFLNHTFKFPGRVTWDNVTLTMVDPIDPQVAQRVLNMLRQSGYQYPTEDPQLQTGQGQSISKGKAVGAISKCFIVQTDSNGNQISKWILNNPWIVSADFGGTLDYSSDELMEVTIELAYDWAELVTYKR